MKAIILSYLLTCFISPLLAQDNFDLELIRNDSCVEISLKNNSDSVMVFLYSAFGDLSTAKNIFVESGRSSRFSFYSLTKMNSDSIIDPAVALLNGYVLLPKHSIKILGKLSSSPIALKKMKLIYRFMSDYHHLDFLREMKETGWYTKYDWSECQESLLQKCN